MKEEEIKKTINRNNKKGYSTRNVTTVNDKYFSINNSLINSFNDDLNISFGSSENSSSYLNTSEILKILKGSNNYQKQRVINNLSEYFYSTNGVYASLIDKTVGIPCFDRIIARGSKEKLKKHYIKVLRAIGEKFFGKDTLKSFLRNGVYFGYLSYLERNDNAIGTEKSGNDEELQLVSFSDISVIPLSPNYTRVLSTDGKTYRIGIDVSQLSNTDLAGFPREIYNAVKKHRERYNKSKKNKNTNIFSQQFFVLDEKRTFVLKNKAIASESSGRAQFVTTIIELLHDMNLGNKKAKMLPKIGKDLVYETYPEGSKGKGTSSLTKTQMDSQHDFIADALNDLTSYTDTSFVSIHPGTKLDKISLSENLNSLTSDDILKRLGTHSGVSMGFLNGENLKSDKTLLYLYEIMSSEIDDFMVQFEKELNKILRYTVMTKANIDFPYISYLPTNRLNRKDYVTMYHKMFTDAGGSYQMYLASAGIAPELQLDLMDEEEELKFRDKYKPHPMASTSSWQVGEEEKETTTEDENETKTVKDKKEVEDEEGEGSDE